jgi:E3 ubiquitin-protein ligase SHPRH
MICPLLWRTSKVDVEDQIQIPPQSEVIHWVSLSPTEEQLYKLEHIRCYKKMLSSLSRQPSLDVRLQTMPVDVLDKIMQPFTCLRQVSCHSDAVLRDDEEEEGVDTHTMESLCQSLISAAKEKCCKNIQTVVSSLNGTYIFLIL